VRIKHPTSAACQGMASRDRCPASTIRRPASRSTLSRATGVNPRGNRSETTSETAISWLDLTTFGACPPEVRYLQRSNAAWIASLSPGSCSLQRNPICRPTADVGMVAMLSQLITEPWSRPFDWPTATSTVSPRILEVIGAMVTLER
jgi:hypothetical protein